MTVLPSVFALVMTAVFDATGTIRAVAGQAGQIDENGRIVNGGRALTADSVSSIFSACFGGAPAAAYIESTVGVAAGAKSGLAAATVGVMFLLVMFVSPLAASRAFIRDGARFDVCRPADACKREQASYGRSRRRDVRTRLRRVHRAVGEHRDRASCLDSARW